MAAVERLRWFEYIYSIAIILAIILLSFTAVISYIFYLIVYLISCFFKNYGNFITITDVFLDEEFADLTNKNSIVMSLTLQGNILLEDLRSIFTENVLNKRSNVNPSKLRYPKLKQYLTTFLGFRIWKNDPDFLIDNHIVGKNWNGDDLGSIHQEYIKKAYKKERSPWELVLIQNVQLNENSVEVPTSILVLRTHHVMAGGGSLLQLLVEGLGNKQLKTVSPRTIVETRWDKLKFILCVPYQYISETIRILRLAHISFDHPWKLRERNIKPTSQAVVEFSSKIPLSNLKKVSRQNCVNVSAVVMSIIAGAIRQVIRDKWDKEVAIGYPLPRPNPPEGLTNHSCISILSLPTDQPCEFKRLQQCNQEFNKMRDEQSGRYLFINTVLSGLQIYPINRIFYNVFAPTAITNNAGENETFFVGNTKCIDMCVSVGPQRGVIGVGFCAWSYKDAMRIAVISEKSTLPKESAKKVVKHIELELQKLLELAK